MARGGIIVSFYEPDPRDETAHGRDVRFEPDEIYHHECGEEVKGASSHLWAPPAEESEWRMNVSDRRPQLEGLSKTDAWAGKAKFGGQPVQER